MFRNLLNLFFFSVCILGYSSCVNETHRTTLSIEDTSEDSVSTAVEKVSIVEEEDSLKEEKTEVYRSEAKELEKKIEQEYGKQWDFCTCIQKQDSVNTALIEANDDEFDLIMERSDYIDNKCKGILIQPNATPEERQKHQQRVKKCLDLIK